MDYSYFTVVFFFLFMSVVVWFVPFSGEREENAVTTVKHTRTRTHKHTYTHELTHVHLQSKTQGYACKNVSAILVYTHTKKETERETGEGRREGDRERGRERERKRGGTGG